jgi:2-(3-amino-3-carboxypropyl)histidine synthase
MEDDRAATNLGPSAEDGMTEEPVAASKQPKRRFVGRKTAEKVAGKTDPNANIEDSGTIQGVRLPQFFLMLHSRC